MSVTCTITCTRLWWIRMSWGPELSWQRLRSDPLDSFWNVKNDIMDVAFPADTDSGPAMPEPCDLNLSCKCVRDVLISSFFTCYLDLSHKSRELVLKNKVILTSSPREAIASLSTQSPCVEFKTFNKHIYSMVPNSISLYVLHPHS